MYLHSKDGFNMLKGVNDVFREIQCFQECFLFGGKLTQVSRLEQSFSVRLRQFQEFVTPHLIDFFKLR